MPGSRDVATVVVVGAGFMGSAISVVYARAGIELDLVDVSDEQLTRSRANMRAALATLAAHGLLDGQSVEDVLARVRLTTDLADVVRSADLVQEAVFEDLAMKTALFRELDELCRPETILASNTASFRIRDLALATRRADRVLGIHFISPATILKPVEIIITEFTSPETLATARGFIVEVGKVPIVCRDVPGFLVNRIQLALVNVCHAIVEQGLATAEDVDLLIRLSVGPRLALWGPLKQEDLVVNKATMLAAMKYLFKETGESRYQPTKKLEAMVARGEVGMLGGRGWYDYAGRSQAEIEQIRDAAVIEVLKFLEEVESRTRV
jgi:3-hydroxybutyryl-CoA dehydrogenase